MRARALTKNKQGKRSANGRKAASGNTPKQESAAPHSKPASSDRKRRLPPFVDILFPRTGENHEPLVDDILIIHPDFADIFEALQDLDDLDQSVLSEHGILFTGESRLGKTRLLSEYIATRMPKRTEAGLEMPVLYMQIAERPTIRSVAIALLREFGEVPSPKDSAGDMLNTLEVLGAECGLKVICLDDLHHFVDQRSEQGQFELTEWLKRLVMRMKVALVVCGLERTAAAIRLNEQLYSRMDCRMQIRRFDWSKTSDRDAFEQIVEGFQQSVKREFTLPKEAKDPFRWYVACSGKIGFLIKIGRRMIKLARKSRTRVISREMLDKAWQRSRYDSPNVDPEMQPFSKSFNCKPEANIIKSIMNTGVELGPKDAKEVRSARGKKMDLRHAMTT